MLVTPPTRNIGGGILFSHNHETFLEISVSEKVYLQVIPLEDQDTYAAMLFREEQEPLEIARHPNGHSCRALLLRMIAGDLGRVVGQLDYIKDCGGVTMDPVAFALLMQELALVMPESERCTDPYAKFKIVQADNHLIVHSVGYQGESGRLHAKSLVASGVCGRGWVQQGLKFEVIEDKPEPRRR